MKLTRLGSIALAVTVATLLKPETSMAETIDTPNGPISTTTQTVDPAPQRIVSASSAEVRAFEVSAAEARNFVTAQLGSDAQLSLETLDLAFRSWQVDKSRRFTEHRVVQILGAYLGRKLVSDLNMEWVVVTDQYGTDYAVRSKRVEVLSFPFAAVSKRIERSQYDFMAGVYYAVANTIRNGDVKER